MSTSRPARTAAESCCTILSYFRSSMRRWQAARLSSRCHRRRLTRMRIHAVLSSPGSRSRDRRNRFKRPAAGCYDLITQLEFLPLWLLLRTTIFVVIAAWTVDKFVRPEYAISIFEHFPFVKEVGSAVVYALAS